MRNDKNVDYSVSLIIGRKAFHIGRGLRGLVRMESWYSVAICDPMWPDRLWSEFYGAHKGS